jgi:hypothetical protein
MHGCTIAGNIERLLKLAQVNSCVSYGGRFFREVRGGWALLPDDTSFWLGDLRAYLLALATEAYTRAATVAARSPDPDVTTKLEWLDLTDRARTLEFWARLPSRHVAATARALAKRLAVKSPPTPIVTATEIEFDDVATRVTGRLS